MSSSARDQILTRIRAANRAANRVGADADAAYAALPREYLRAHHDAGITGLFAERAADYRAVVERVPAAELAAAIARVLAARSAEKLFSRLASTTLARRCTSASGMLIATGHTS